MQNEFVQALWDAGSKYADYAAVIDEDGERTTTYRELHELVSRVIAWLDARGAARGSLIPILLPQSMEYLAAEIGIWTAGCAAVPMGTAFPPDRIDFICNHCNAPFVIDGEAWRQIEATAPADFGGAPDFPALDQPALLIYTSGSTGNPKGILHTFASLNSDHCPDMGLESSPATVGGIGAPLYFVASIECFTVLAGGGQVHLFSSETYRDMRKLERYIAEHGITDTFLSPSMLASFHNSSKTLKKVFTGSERLTGQASRDGYTLINCYGMSETKGTVAAFPVERPYDTTPVGTPHDEWCLLDDEGSPVAVGEEGELCLRGCFCREYYKDPERTAELFRDGWLHTGDLMRELPDGNLVYVNRKDWMAKVNGQRVEPGEVENAILKLEGIGQAVVKAFDADGGGQYLCAFFTGTASGEDVRAEIARTLPPYMVPAFFVQVDKFALLPNGKVNRKVLMPPDASELRSDYVAPETPGERELCDAFAELFSLERVGVDDDFFLLGGDSIRVMKLQQMCEDLPLSTKVIVAQRTPRKIASALAEISTAGEAAATAEGGAQSADDAPVPLTQTQLGIYVESMARAGEAVYNNPALLALDPALDDERLARAIEETIEAHSFVKLHVEEDEAGEPFMVPGCEPYAQGVENMGDADFEALKPRLVEPFDLHAGPLFRIRVIRTPEHLYLFNDFHHLVYDGGSARVIVEDISRAYAGEAVEPERYTGFDLARDEVRDRATPAYDEARAWNETAFSGLDVDSVPRPDVPAQPGIEPAFAQVDHTIEVDRELIGRFCRRTGVTANVLALGAFGKLLGAYSNSDEALFATIFNGRDDLRVARTVDMMVKTLPLHCAWDADTRVAEYLQAVNQRVMGAMAHDLYSFAEIAASCGVTSDVLFAYQGDYLDVESVCGSAFERIPLAFNATGSPIDFQVFACAQGLRVHAEYRSDLYSAAFVENMARSYGCVLRGMLAAERLADIELVDAGQLAVLDGFNETEVPYDRSQTIVSLFAAAATRHPGNIAVLFENERFTYRELDELTDRLAGRMRSLGLGTGDVVSVLVPRGPWMPLAALGACKAGCAYQPLDATYPPERLNFMVGDADAKLLVATPDLRPLITDYDGEVLLVDDPRKTLAPGGSPALPDADAPDGGLPAPDDLFVLLYTSGTTGVPKGVRLTHGNLVCFVAWYRRYFGLLPQHSVGSYASFGFDACMMDMFATLTCGATLVIVPEEMRLDLPEIARYYERNNVSRAFFTTQVGRQFALDANCPSIEHLFMGGETLVPFEAPSHPRIHNAYGPSECTVISNVYELEGGEASYPIGKVVDNMKGYVVSAQGRRLPVGAEGELWLAGPQVGHGYLNRPEKTAEAFAENPFDGGAHARLYRTGDIVRYRRDGSMEFVGRRDGQVKIRGFRIELAEVEAVVRDFPDVRDATVAAFDHPAGGKYIAAYIVADGELDSQALADFIRERKPPYMVPAAIMQIERIPLNQNGKVNRRALPAPKVSVGEIVEPRTEAQRAIYECVAEVVGHREFGITTDLHDAGLNSIGSMRLCTLVSNKTGKPVRTADLVNHPTVEQLEAYLSALADAPAYELRDSYPLTQTQNGIFAECVANIDTTIYNVPLFCRLDPSVDVERLVQAARAAIDAHPYLKMRLALTPDGEVQALRFDDAEPEVQVISCEEPPEADGLVTPYRLLEDALYRLQVFTCKDASYLFCDMHHIIADGESLGIFIRDLNAAYDGKALEPEAFTGFEAALDEERRRATDELARAKAYYDELLAEVDPESLPQADYIDGCPDVIATLDLEAGLAAADVKAFCERTGTTANAFFNAAFGFVLAEYLGRDDVPFATIYNGRADSRLANSMSMLVKTLPVRCDISDGQRAVADYVTATGRQLLDSMEHDLYSFAEISREYGVTASVLFAYQGTREYAASIGGARAEALPVGLSAPKAPFGLDVVEVDGGYRFYFEYDPQRYLPETIRAFSCALAQVSREFTCKERLVDVTLLSPGEEEALWNLHDTDWPIPSRPAYRLLQDSAAAHPDALAVVTRDVQLTYAQLNAAANRLGHVLAKRGVGEDVVVAIMMPRCAEVYIAREGVLKSGGAFLFIDPDYPDERVQFICRDADAHVLVTTPGLRESRTSLIDGLGIPTLALADGAVASAPEENLDVPVPDGALAYCIYTSGSTGKPKGVMITQRNLVNFVDVNPKNHETRLFAEGGGNSLALAAFTFDVSIMEEFIPLANGMTIVMADEDEIHNPLALRDLCARYPLSVMSCTPSYLMSIVDVPEMSPVISTLRAIDMGAEAFPPALYGKLRAVNPRVRILNGYGPTEATVSCTMAEITGAEHITIGVPNGNMRALVMDAAGRVLPRGAVGELVVVGEGVGRGYRNRDDLNEKVFFAYRGRAAYRCGDAVRLDANGDLEFRGRTDDQVKLRGLRIELGEVENAMLAFPGVTRAVCIVRNDAGQDYLAGYFTADVAVDAGELRAHLRRSLTAYMVPGVLMQLDEMPLTTSRKVDKRALPAPAPQERAAKARGHATELEARIAQMMAVALNLDDIDGDDDFFEMGGTSLSASRVAMKAMTEGIPVAYADIFDHPTPRELAAFMQGKLAAGAGAAAEATAGAGAGGTDGAAGGTGAPVQGEFAEQLAFNTMAHIDEIAGGQLGDVLLTGATGFLGIHVLHHLVARTDSRVTCLMRSGASDTCEKRLKSLLMFYFSDPHDAAFASGRLRTVEGDITDAEGVAALAGGHFDTAINCAACVKHFAHDDVLQRVNVEGVRNLVDLCVGAGSRLVQISTVSVGGENVNHALPEQACIAENMLEFGQDLSNKYVRSKFDAEALVLASVRDRGLDAKIVRVGNLMSRASDGEFQVNALTNGFMRNLRGYVAIGAFPVDLMAQDVEFSPIDAVAEAICLLAGTPRDFTVFHAVNGHMVEMGDVVAALNAAGLPIEAVPAAEFEARMVQAMGTPEKADLVAGLVSYLSPGADTVRSYVGEDHTFTKNALYRLGYRWPIISEPYLVNAIEALDTMGFFEGKGA